MKASAERLQAKPTDRTQRLTPLVKRAQDGDNLAFEQLVQETEKLARRIALSVVPEYLVEDVLQESYLLVYRKLILLREPKAFTSWFGRLVLHCSYNMAKKQEKTSELDDRQGGEDQTESVVTQVALRNAISRLEQKDRNVLILREMMELSYDEIAGALRLKVGTVRSRLHAARKHLAQRFTKPPA